MGHRKSGAERLDRWKTKYTAPHVAALIEKTMEKMTRNAEVAFEGLVQTELATKAVLNCFPVSVSDVPGFLCFAREMWKAHQKYAGRLLQHETEVKIAKWHARGLDEDALWTIACQVYNVPRPEVQP